MNDNQTPKATEVPIPLALLMSPGTISTYSDERGVYMCVWIREKCAVVETGAPALHVVATAMPGLAKGKYTCSKCHGQGHQSRTCPTNGAKKKVA